jgi:TldD protein
LPPYFLSYSVSDASAVAIRAQFGALVDSSANRVRVADVQVRLGDAQLDNTHGTHRGSAVNSLQLPLTDDREALGRSLWLATNTGYGTALDNYLRVKTEAEVRAKEEDTSPDFSQERRRWHRQGGSAGGGGSRGMGAAGAGALEGLSRVPGCLPERGDADGAE